MKLLIVRHGVTDWNVDGRFQGQLDVPLNPAGLTQARKLAHRLSDDPIEIIFTSNLARARDTAVEIAVPHNTSPIVDQRLCEINFGEWEGRYFEEIAQNDAERLSAWRKHDSLQSSPPGGERLDQVSDRLHSFMDDLARHAVEHSALIVTHGGAGSVMLCLLLGLPPIRYWQFHMSQAGLTEVELKSDRVRLNYFNDTCHL